jgi:hypothetical protein
LGLIRFRVALKAERQYSDDVIYCAGIIHVPWAVLGRGNSLYRGKLRRFEKNRDIVLEKILPWAGEKLSRADIKELIRWARAGEAIFSPGEWVRLKLKIHAGTLYHLIDAIPQAERDAQEIYPGDFRKGRIPAPPHTNWNARKLEWWRALGWNLVGIGEKKTFDLKDYSQSKELLFKQGRRETVDCQKAVSPVRRILLIERARDYGLDPHWDIVWRDCEIRLSLHLLGTLKTPEEQWLLKRVGRLYKIDCYWPKWPAKQESCLFDACRSSSSAAASWVAGRYIQRDAVAEETVADFQQTAFGGSVVILIPGVHRRHVAARRYRQLAATREAYNAAHGSYWNIGGTKPTSSWDFGIRIPNFGVAGVSKILREQGSLNIPLDTNLIEKLEHDNEKAARPACRQRKSYGS